MKIFRQTTLATALLALLILLTSTNQAQANIFNKFREGFYFEKYKTAEEAKTELLKLHPIGSDVQPLIETLEKAGCSASKVDQTKLNAAKKTNSKYREIDEVLNFVSKTGFLNWVEWRISVFVESDKINYIGIGKEYTGL